MIEKLWALKSSCKTGVCESVVCPSLTLFSLTASIAVQQITKNLVVQNNTFFFFKSHRSLGQQSDVGLSQLKRVAFLSGGSGSESVPLPISFSRLPGWLTG